MKYKGVEEGVGELIIHISDSRAQSYAWAGVEKSRLHRHPFTEVYYILAAGYTNPSEPGYVYVDGERREVRKGDVEVIKPCVEHCAENVSLIVSCTPGYNERFVRYD